MTCDECRAGLVFYIGRQLPPAEEVEMAGHLEGCEECRRELEEETRFTRRIHNASTTFRMSTARLEERLSRGTVAGNAPLRNLGQAITAPARMRKALVAGVAVCVVIALLIMVRAPEGKRGTEMDYVASWAVAHYSLIDQTHPLQGDADAVRAWFKEHHQIDVSPPQRADYSTLAGCKMAELDSEPAPMLRFEGRDTSAVFMLPSRFRGIAGAGLFRTRGFVIRVWSEEGSPYLMITRDASGGT